MEGNYLIKGPISESNIKELLEKAGEMTDCGGHSFFLGQVRADETEGKKVRSIEYSAYTELVDAEADRIIKKVLNEFSDVRAIDIIHSTGIVKAGEISLLVFISAGHRHQAMAACSKTVELIKEKFPVWKKEIFEDDTYIWK
jgi:molybdopterin synthase catalytic subunit